MKLYDIIRMSNANLWRNKSRTFLTVLAIFIWGVYYYDDNWD